MLKGIGASQGVGIGKAVIIEENNLDYSAVKYSTDEKEKARLKTAVEKFINETRQLARRLNNNAREKQAEILEGHISMISDPFLLSQMNDNIDGGLTAEEAADKALAIFYKALSGADDEIMRLRAADVKDIKDSILKILLCKKITDIEALPTGSVIVAKALTPSMISRIKKENVLAAVSETGGVSDHSAVLLKSLEIPAVFSVKNLTSCISDGALLIVDGFEGEVITEPSEEKIAQYTQRQKEYIREKEKLNFYYNKPTVTKFGIVKKVYGNIAKAQEAKNVLLNGGEGIGLFRTEFLFMNRFCEPDEQEQLEEYSTAARIMGEKEVIIRTLDIGGDKNISYLHTEKEDNPFLGHRAIRYCLDNKPLFKTQIRAILRAAAFGNIKILLPFVISVNEIKKAKEIFEECAKELESEGLKYRRVPIGAMIETPSAAIISDLLAKQADFFFIGTNDLSACIMAADRANSKVAQLCDIFNPSVLRAIEMAIKNAKKEGITVGLCGEAAENTELIPKLIEWGLDEFSVTPSSILKTRKAICEYK